jgi:VWFA-related protein
MSTSVAGPLIARQATRLYSVESDRLDLYFRGRSANPGTASLRQATHGRAVPLREIPGEHVRFARIQFRLLCAAMMVASLGPAARAQEAPPGPLPPRTGVQPEKTPPRTLPSDLQKRAIRVRVNEVVAPVTVRNAKGEMLFDLTQENFHVFDNGVEQKIEHFDLGGEALSIVLAVETSSHIEPMMPSVRHTGLVFAETVMALTSEVSVIGFDDDVELLEKFTTDPDSVEKAIQNLRLGTSGMRLYDAMARGITLLQHRPEARRRILVVIGEAQDTGSENALGEVLRMAHMANVSIYTIGLSTAMADLRARPREHSQIGPPGTFPVPTPNGQPQTPELERQMQESADLMPLIIWLLKTGKNAIGPNSLEIASKSTGGLHMSVKKDASIEKAVDAIGGEIHAQYTLGYRPAGDEPSGYHEIKVTVDRPNVSVRTRPGYYLAPPES